MVSKAKTASHTKENGKKAKLTLIIISNVYINI